MKSANKNFKNILGFTSLILLLAGIVVLFYPHICQKIFQRHADKMIKEYEQRMSESADDGVNEENSGDNGSNWDWLYELMVAYNQELYKGKQEALVDPFSYQQVDFSLMEFGFDEEMIGYLSIPKIDVRLPIYLGANLDNLRKGAAHLTQTSLPVGGENTNAVIAAHRGLSTAAMFRDIEKLEIGDKVTITNFRETLTYYVSEVAVISPTDIDKILIQDGRDLVTLITCHPYRHNYQRYIVYLER